MKYLRVKKAADFLNCSVSHVWNLVKAGELTTIKLSPRVTVFSIDILEAYVSSKVA
jgi:excisionase family DNA binding protein